MPERRPACHTEVVIMKCIVAVLVALISVASVQAAVKSQAVQYKHGDVILEGYLAYDDSQSGKRPGVLVVHEWLGLNDYAKKRADMLASMGYVAFALDMYGKGVLGKGPQDGTKLSAPFKENRQLMRDRAKAGLDVLRNHPLVDSSRIAAIGYCFGGATAIELARAGTGIAGVVGFHPALGTSMPAKPGQVKAKILVCHGADDPFVPPPEVKAFEEEMQKAGADWQLNAYGNAVHGFTNWGAGNNKSSGVAYNSEADKRSWQAMKDFFAEIFAK